MSTLVQRHPWTYAASMGVTAIPVGEPGASEAGSYGTLATTLRVTFPSSYCNYKLEPPVIAEGFELINDTPAVFELDGFNATRLANGIGVVRLACKDYSFHKFLDFRSTDGGTVVYFDGFANDTLGKATLDLLLARMTEGKESPYYNAATYANCLAAGGILRNPDCWAADMDFSGVPVSFLYGGFWGGGALVTPRHLLVCNHYEPATSKVGMTIRFADNNGNVCTRSVVAQTSGSIAPAGTIGNRVYPIGDICMLLLDQDVPAAINYYPVPGDWLLTETLVSAAGNLARYNFEMGCAFVTLNQNRATKWIIGSVYDPTRLVENPLPSFTMGGAAVTHKPIRSVVLSSMLPLSSNFDAYSAHQNHAITGDSGSPVFVPTADGGLVLATVLTTGSSGTRITKAVADAMILEVDSRAGVSTGYTVTEATDPTL